MPLPAHYFPHRGQILICDYSRGFVPPEMVKMRLAVVVSAANASGGLVLRLAPFHHYARPSPGLARTATRQQVPGWGWHLRWAKCDMLAPVAFARLDMPHTKRPGGGRQYHRIFLEQAVLAAVVDGVNQYIRG